jgi:glycosyltransferase involved in cell wall biosynthesis
MRLAYLTSRYPTISHTFIQREVAALRRRGVQIETFSIRRPDGSQLLTRIDEDEASRTTSILPAEPSRVLATHARAFWCAPGRYLETLGMSLRLRSGGPRSALWRLFYFAEAILLHRELERRGLRHVHVHFANVGADVAMLATRYGSRPGSPWTWSFTMHGPTEFYSVDEHRLGDKVDAADMVVCISDYARSQLMRASASESWPKLRVVHCGIDCDRFDAEPAPGGSGRLDVLFVGRLVADKGPQLALEAVHLARAQGRDARLTLVGDGPERNRLERRASELGLGDVVSFEGSVGQDRIRDYYSECDVFCLPSFAEGVPIVLMEAMAMRRPVVTTTVMGIPELVEDGENGLLVRPGRVDELADAMIRLADEPDLRVRLGAAGRRRVMGDFEIGRSAQALERLFSAVTDRGAASAAPVREHGAVPAAGAPS